MFLIFFSVTRTIKLSAISVAVRNYCHVFSWVPCHFCIWCHHETKFTVAWDPHAREKQANFWISAEWYTFSCCGCLCRRSCISRGTQVHVYISIYLWAELQNSLGGDVFVSHFYIVRVCEGEQWVRLAEKNKNTKIKRHTTKHIFATQSTGGSTFCTSEHEKKVPRACITHCAWA